MGAGPIHFGGGGLTSGFPHLGGGRGGDSAIFWEPPSGISMIRGFSNAPFLCFFGGGGNFPTFLVSATRGSSFLGLLAPRVPILGQIPPFLGVSSLPVCSWALSSQFQIPNPPLFFFGEGRVPNSGISHFLEVNFPLSPPLLVDFRGGCSFLPPGAPNFGAKCCVLVNLPVGFPFFAAPHPPVTPLHFTLRGGSHISDAPPPRFWGHSPTLAPF